ncbi:MAG: DUF4956 domain-containing protein [Prevotella sp.]|nr:DUF4956 domain-containing protein [Prevotella sp.]MBO7128318.1 DUF4956 domain-containing protein [Prevotella sp.]
MDVLSAEFAQAMVKFLICIVVNWIIIFQLYFRKSHRRDFSFTFMLMSIAIYFLVFFMMGMERGKATMGVGLGLFGIFSIMRYRTDAMPVREMTYLFLIICLSVVHAMASEYIELFIIDAIVLVAITACEMTMKIQPTKIIQYDRVELVKPEKREELKADLEQRTGLKILKIDVGGIDFLKDSVVLRITYESDNRKYMRLDDVGGQFTVKKSQWREV